MTRRWLPGVSIIAALAAAAAAAGETPAAPGTAGVPPAPSVGQSAGGTAGVPPAPSVGQSAGGTAGVPPAPSVGQSAGETPAVPDWPQWRGPTRDGVSPEKGLLEKWPEGGLEKVWEAVLTPGDPKPPAASPIVAGGKVFAVSRRVQDKKYTNVMHCLSAADGKGLWKYEWPGHIYAPPHATPAAAGGRVFYLDGQANLFCLDAADGKVVWSLTAARAAPGVPAATSYGAAASPLVDGQTVYVGTGAFKAADGSPVFKPEAWGGHSSTILGTLGGKRLLISHAAGLDAASGAEAWKIEGQGAICTPVLAGQRLLTVGVDEGADKKAVKHVRLYRIAGADGKLSAEKVWAQPKLPASGNPRYQVPSFLVSGDHAYGQFGFSYKSLTCFSLADGQIKWAADPKAMAVGLPCYPSPVLADGRLYVLDGKGTLFLVKDDPGKFTLLGQAQVCGPTAASPALAGGRIYVSDAARLVCLKVK